MPEDGSLPELRLIPETLDAIDELDDFEGFGDLSTSLTQMGDRVRAIVPDCIGLSLAVPAKGLVFTLAASSREAATLDGLQYVDGGPCVEALDQESVTETSSEQLLDESQWRLFAHGTARYGIESSLTLPIMRAGKAAGTINLYASSSAAFTGHVEELAEVLGAWAEGAVSNADLSFQTRLDAAQTPAVLRDRARIDTAVGIIAARHHTDVASAHHLLVQAAAQAGVSASQLARVIINGPFQ